jgi:plasmid stabilization system protein ParE
MTEEGGFALHPLATQDITEIWEDIAADNPLAGPACPRENPQRHSRLSSLT